MIIYIVFFIISAFISIFDFTNISSFQKKSIFIFFILAIILFFGGRYNCDNDYKNYISFYDITPALHKMSWNKFVKIYIQYQVEPLFFLFSSLFKAIGVNGQSIIFFYAFCTFSLIAKVIEKTSPFPLSSFFLFSTCYFSLPFIY